MRLCVCAKNRMSATPRSPWRPASRPRQAGSACTPNASALHRMCAASSSTALDDTRLPQHWSCCALAKQCCCYARACIRVRASACVRAMGDERRQLCFSRHTRPSSRASSNTLDRERETGGGVDVDPAGGPVELVCVSKGVDRASKSPHRSTHEKPPQEHTPTPASQTGSNNGQVALT